MQPHQERVVAEKAELDEKVRKLADFFGNELFKTLPANDRYLLTKQLDVMRQYSDILGKRIANF